jgi:transposase-like protein
MPAPHPREFRDDVVVVTRQRGPETSLRQIAEAFGISNGTLSNWMEDADV